MSKEKQSGDCKNRNNHVNEVNEMATTIYSFLRSDTMSRAMASLLYGEGYRKQSEPISCTHENGGEWISVEDRLPERPGKYLVYTVKGATKLGEFCSYLVDDEPQFDWYVTHWMPLPEPPKMKGGE